MAANGQTRDVLERCVCSIDLVATILPYEKYVEAETVLRVSQVGGEKTSMFKTSPALQKIVAELRRAELWAPASAGARGDGSPNRHPREGGDPELRSSEPYCPWMPACAGMTGWSDPPHPCPTPHPCESRDP